MALIEAGLIKELEEDLDLKVTFDGQVHNYSEMLPADDPDYRGMKRPKFVSAVTKEVSGQVYDYAKTGKLVLTLGGDHSIAMGTVSGTARAMRERLGREIAVIWVDAHADINTPETSDSGNIHGMPVAFLTGLATETREDVFGWLQAHHMLSTKKLVYIGLRDIDRGEKKILREHGIKAFSMHDVDRLVIQRTAFDLTDLLTFVSGTASARLWIWHWPGLAAIPLSIFPSTSTHSTPCGHPAPVQRSGEV
jgi:arginase